jgi:hypothetical protein
MRPHPTATAPHSSPAKSSPTPYSLRDYRNGRPNTAPIPTRRPVTAVASWIITLDDHEIDNLGDDIPQDRAAQSPEAALPRRTVPPAGSQRILVLDGKSVRGSGSGQQDARHLLAAIDHRTGEVLGQVDVDGETKEIPMLPVRCNGLTIWRWLSSPPTLCTRTVVTPTTWYSSVGTGWLPSASVRHR